MGPAATAPACEIQILGRMAPVSSDADAWARHFIFKLNLLPSNA
jgi:hypothetical protein